MRQTIELLKKQSIQAGLTSAHIQSMGQKVNNGRNEGSPTKKNSQNGLNHHHHHNHNNNHNEDAIQSLNENGNMQRHLSTDSVCSINSIGSNCSGQDKKKKKGWVSY
jgi:neuron navigator 2